MNITVKKPSPNDRAQWETLYRQYADFYQVPMDDEILNTVWSWIFNKAQPFYALFACDEEKNIVGLMHFHEMPSPLRGKAIGFLNDLYVLPESRGSGAVDALFEALETERSNRSWPYFRWLTADNNYRARTVYDKLAERTGWITYHMAAAT